MAAHNRGMTVAAATPTSNASSVIGATPLSSSALLHRNKADLAESLFAGSVDSSSTGLGSTRTVTTRNGSQPNVAAGQLQEQQRAQWKEMLAAQSISATHSEDRDLSEDASAISNGEAKAAASESGAASGKPSTITEQDQSSSLLSTRKSSLFNISEIAQTESRMQALTSASAKASGKLSAELEGSGASLPSIPERSETASSAHAKSSADHAKNAAKDEKLTAKQPLAGVDGTVTLAPVQPAEALSPKTVQSSGRAPSFSSSSNFMGSFENETAGLQAQRLSANTAMLSAAPAHTQRSEGKDGTESSTSVSSASAPADPVFREAMQERASGINTNPESGNSLGADSAVTDGTQADRASIASGDPHGLSFIAHVAGSPAEAQTAPSAHALPTQGEAKVEAAVSGSVSAKAQSGKAVPGSVDAAKASGAGSLPAESDAVRAGNAAMEKQMPAHGAPSAMQGVTGGTAALSPVGHVQGNPITTPGVTGHGTAAAAGESPFQVMDMESGDASSVRAGSAHAQASGSGLVAGYHDPQIGYVELKAHLGGDGVHASLAAATPEGSAVLEKNMNDLQQWLHERQTPVETLSLVRSTADTSRGHSFSDGAGQGSMQQQNSGGSGSHASHAERNPSSQNPSQPSHPAASLPAISGEDAFSGSTIHARLPVIDMPATSSRISVIA